MEVPIIWVTREELTVAGELSLGIDRDAVRGGALINAWHLC